MSPTEVLTTAYGAFLVAQLVLVGIGLPVSFAIVLRSLPDASRVIARIVSTWDGRLRVGLPLLLIVLLAPLPATWGLVNMVSAPELRWPVYGWIVYLTASATPLAVVWVVSTLARLVTSPLPERADPRPAQPTFVAQPPVGIDFLWQQGVRVIGEQLNTADGLDRKITPLLAATIATAGIVLTQKDALRDFTALLILELAVTAVFFVLALTVRTFQTVPRLSTIAPYAAASQQQLEFALLGNLLDANALNDRALSGKTVMFNAAIAAVFVFLLTGFVAIQRIA